MDKKKLIFVLGGIGAVGLAAFAGYKVGWKLAGKEVKELVPNLVSRVGYEAVTDAIGVINTHVPDAADAINKVYPNNNEFLQVVSEVFRRNKFVDEVADAIVEW